MAFFFKHPDASVESWAIGDDTRVRAFDHILPGVVVGRECTICDHVFIETAVVVGDRVTLKYGVQIRNCVTLEDNVFAEPQRSRAAERQTQEPVVSAMRACFERQAFVSAVERGSG